MTVGNLQWHLTSKFDKILMFYIFLLWEKTAKCFTDRLLKIDLHSEIPQTCFVTLKPDTYAVARQSPALVGRHYSTELKSHILQMTAESKFYHPT